MRYLFIVMSLMFAMVACSKHPERKFQEERMEAKKEYKDDMRDIQKEQLKATQKRDEKIDKAKKDLNQDL